MKKLTAMMAMFSLAASAIAQQASLKSPDGRLDLSVGVADGKPTYSVTYEGKKLVLDSPLGFESNVGDFTKDVTFLSADSKEVKVEYSLDRIKHSSVKHDACELTVHLKAGERPFDVRFHLSNNDVAFRYELPKFGETASIRITSEATGFRFPEQTTTFLCPQSDAMIGWKRTKPSYEEEYNTDAPMTDKSLFGHGYTFPCLFRVGGDGWVLVSETGVDSRYCASHLSDYKGEGLYEIAFPMPEENNGNGTTSAAFALPGATAWRTLTVGATLNPIVETTIPYDVVEERYASANTYSYGKGTWSWILWQDDSINYEDQVKYIDFSAAMGFQFVLIDNWWNLNIGRQRMEELVKYAHSKGIDVFLWYSSSGYWNDIEQGPINCMDNSIVRKQQMRWMKSMGVKGIKVDFFGGDKQETMRLYEEILSDADDNGLMVIFHGCTIPRGWERMYPNYVGSEAVLASENMIFGQGFCDEEAKNTCLHPFIRNTIGCMEWGGCFMNKRMSRSNERGNIRRTTDIFELCTTVLFQNPIQNFALAPNNLEDAPKTCLDFISQVPTTWDETRLIDGYPGKYIVLARRSKDTWYVASVSAQKDPVELTVDLSGLLSKGDKLAVYSIDKKTSQPVKAEQVVKNAQKVKVSLSYGNGVLMVK